MGSSLTLDENKRPILCYISFLQRAVSHCVGGVGDLCLYASQHLHNYRRSLPVFAPAHPDTVKVTMFLLLLFNMQW